MKIGYLIPSCSVSGGMAVICQHGNRLMQRGHSVVFLSTVDLQPMDWFPTQQVPVYKAEHWEGELDIVVATGWSTAFWLTQVAARVKCYFVQSDETRFHPDDSKWQHLATLTYYLGVHYLTEARWIQKWLHENFGHDAALIPNGLDANIFHPTSPLQAKGSRPRILLEGAIGLPYKGMREAFEVVKDIDAEVWCVSSYGVPEVGWKCDRFFEHVPMQDMKRIYSSCDILLKLSRVEGFFGPPMEMMACGGASVVGRVTGYDEYIKDGHNALVVDPLDISAARQAVQLLISNSQLRSRIIAAGIQTAGEWGWNSSIDSLEDFYARLISDPKCQYGAMQRSKYDKSITYVYHALTQHFIPDRLATIPSGRETPQHVQILASYIFESELFLHFANGIRLFYRVIKKIRRSILMMVKYFSRLI
jgi:O-antigen biosynthesis protein